MKVIISHDVDHLTAREHLRDLFLLKFMLRNTLEFGLRRITASELRARLQSILNNKWHNLSELMSFDRENSIPSTFFFAVCRGRGLSYSLKASTPWVKRILEQGFDAGVHGIAFKDFKRIKSEYETFKNLSGLDDFGIRIHYLRQTSNTFNLLEKAGYLFDSSSYDLEEPRRIGRLWEFPLHLMDSDLFSLNSGWKPHASEEAKAKTRAIVAELERKKVSYLNILFHDCYFSPRFKSWKDWYFWIIGWCREKNFEFISYREAIKDLEKG